MFKKFHKFTAFTLAEILIVFSIIAIISGLTLMTTKRLQTTDKYAYQKAYDSLLTAAYNAVAEVNAEGITDDPKSLCRGLTKYINSQAARNADDADRFKGNPDTGFCNKITTRVTPSTVNFNDKDEGTHRAVTPDFIANNGMRFYITEQLHQPGVKDYSSDDVGQTIDFYIVFVDLDGRNGQNTTQAGDVVAFAITANADVIPLGVPAYDTHYLGVRVVFPESAHRENETFSESMSYYDAVHTAWGDRQNFDDMRTVHFNDTSIFTILKGKVFMGESNRPDTAHTPEQHPFCICDSEAEGMENCAETTPVEDRFDCDIKIQRYY